MAGIDRWIAHWADHRPEHRALVLEGVAIGYAELDRRLQAMAALLVERAVGPGDRVAFCGLNRIEQLVALFACGRTGAILVPLNNRLSVAEHRYQLHDAAPVVALVTDGFGSALERAAPSLPTVDLDSVDLSQRPVAPAEADAADRVVQGDDPVLMVYTSGTTGRPRGVVHTHRSLLHTVLNGVAHQDLTAVDRVLTVLPLFHVGGLNIQTLPALYVGATVVLQRRFDPGRYLALVAEHRPTQSLVVPAVMDALLRHPDFDATDLSSLRGLNSGSSVVPEHLIRGFLDRGVPVGQVYGATETGPTAVVLRYDDGAERIGSCGKAALHTELRIVDDQGLDVSPGTAGEILVRGPNLFDHYWNQPEATAAAFVDGWYRTGDVARADGDGFVFIEDRLGDVLISGGENVYPAEVENALAEHPAIDQVAVIGLPDERWGEIPVAVIESQQGRPTPSVDELRSWCTDRLARYKQPRQVVVVDELPRTALGKVRKQALRDRLRER